MLLAAINNATDRYAPARPGRSTQRQRSYETHESTHSFFLQNDGLVTQVFLGY